MQEVEQQISDTKTAISAEHDRPVVDETTDQNANYEWATAQLLKAQVEMDSLRARSGASALAVARYRADALRLGDRAIVQQQLLRDMRAAEERYLLYVNKREQARIGDALDRHGILNVAIAEQPAAPALPSRSGLRLALLAFAAATVTSAATGFAFDYLDPSFRTPREVALYLGSPVLASLPKQGKVA